jgi:hypothetical protein
MSREDTLSPVGDTVGDVLRDEEGTLVAPARPRAEHNRAADLTQER